LEGVLNILPLAITGCLIGWNLWASLRILLRTGRALAALPLTLLQIVLFTLFFYQIAWHRGAEHFLCERAPVFLDWAALVLVHAIRAADIVDVIEAYGLNLQAVHNASHLTACTLILYHLVVDLFILRLLMEGVNRWKRSVLESGRFGKWLRWGPIGIVAVFVLVWLLSALFVRPWQASDLLWWPVDNLLRVMDFCDAMEIYRVRLHDVPRLPWEGTLTLICRVMMGVALAAVFSRGVQEISIRWLNCRGLKQEELEQLAERYQDRPFGPAASRRVEELRRFEERSQRVDWPVYWEVLATLGPSFLLGFFLFLASQRGSTEPLVTVAIDEDDAAAGRALRGIRRMGIRAEGAIDLFRESLPDLSSPRQRAVVETLGYLGPPAAEPLSEWLSHEDSQTRLAALQGLRRVGPEAAPALVGALASDDQNVRKMAREAILDLGDEAVQPLMDHMTPDLAVEGLEILDSLDPYWHLRSSDNTHFSALVESREVLGKLLEAKTETQLRTAVREVTAVGPLARRLAVSALANRVRTGSPDLRTAAIRELAQLGSSFPEAIEVFVDLLADENAAVRDEARGALEQRGASAIPALVQALTRRGSDFPEVIDILVGVLADENPSVQQQAIEALEQTGSPAVPALIEGLSHSEPHVRQGAVALLEQIGTPAISALVKDLEDGDPSVQQNATEALARIAAPAVPTLVATLQDGDPGVQQRVAEVLEKIGPPAVPSLIEGFADSAPGVQQRALNVLQRIGAPAIIDRLADDDPHVQRDAAEALQQIGAPAIPTLVDALGDEDGSFARRAAEVLQHIGPPAIPALRKRLAAGDPNIQARVDWVLQQIGAVFFEDLGSGDPSTVRRAAEVLEQIGSPTVPSLVQALGHNEPGVQQRAGEVLGQIGGPAAPALVQALGHSDPDVQRRAADVLEKIGAPAAASLVEGLANSDPGVQRRAADVLEKIGAPAAASLVAGLASSDPGVQRRAAEVYQKIGAPAAATLVEQLADRDPAIQQLAAEVLQKIGEPAVRPLIDSLADSDPSVQQLAAEVLQKIGEPAVLPLVDRLEDSDPSVRQRAAEVLQKIGPWAVAPFGETAAKQHQQSWARILQSSVWQTNSIGMMLVLIPPGEFQMGSATEKPQHKVRITRPFYLAATEVTQEQYHQVMGQNPSQHKGDPQRPVGRASWEDAAEFCRKLSEKEGAIYRLPTEAEWEYACRAGSNTKWCFGDEGSGLGEYAWYSGTLNTIMTREVGTKKPNAWGLYDMHGSVQEWCQDWYDADYYKDSPVDDPTGPSTGSDRVCRGGCWRSTARGCESSFRIAGGRIYMYNDQGFRVAMTVPETKAAEIPKTDDSAAPERVATKSPKSDGAFLVRGSVGGIVNTPLATTIQDHGVPLTASQYKAIKAKDGVCLQQGFYHIFKFPNKGIKHVEWTGYADGNHQVCLCYWNGSGMVLKDIRGARQLATHSVPVSIPASQEFLYVMVNCTSGNVFTDTITHDGG